MGGQVAQDAFFAVAERLGERYRFARRWCRAPAAQSVEDLGDEGGVRRVVPGMALEKLGYRIDEERVEDAVGLGEIQGALEGALGGPWFAERFARDRLQQEGVRQPEIAVRHGSGAVQYRRERDGRGRRVALSE